MFNFTKLDFMDFHFNNKRLSDFGGYVGSTDQGYKIYSVLPSRERVLDRPLNSDVTYQFASSLAPRVFEVPIIFEQLEDDTLRKVANWLDSPVASKFWWVGENKANNGVYINAMLDSQDFDANSSTGQDGQMSLKFICLDPFYYSMNIYEHEITNMVSGKKYTLTNNSSCDIYPHLDVYCNGKIQIDIIQDVHIYDEITEEDTIVEQYYSQTIIDEIVGGVKINSETRTCTLLSGANNEEAPSHFAYLKGSFPVIPSGDFKIKITGNDLTSAKLLYREKFL